MRYSLTTSGSLKGLSEKVIEVENPMTTREKTQEIVLPKALCGRRYIYLYIYNQWSALTQVGNLKLHYYMIQETLNQ